MASSVKSILDDIDCLIPLITFLGSNPYWWARSAPSLSEELSLDPERVQSIFARYPMIFRKSAYIEDAKAYSYALQMRYARRNDGSTTQPGQVSYFEPLSETDIIALIDFLVRISSLDTTLRSSRRTTLIAVLSAVISAITAIIVAILKD